MTNRNVETHYMKNKIVEIYGREMTGERYSIVLKMGKELSKTEGYDSKRT